MATIQHDEQIVFVKTALNPESKQVEDQTIKGIINPPIDFFALKKAYENSFILGGVFEKLASAGSKRFKPTNNVELDTLLANLDMKYVLENVLVFGNAYIEKVRNGQGKIVKLLPFLTTSLNAWLLGEQFGYVQRISGKQQFFLPEEVIHTKTTSLATNFYGESKFSKAVDQIVLLAQIDEYYSHNFDKGFLGTSLLMDKGDTNGKKMSDNNRQLLGEHLRDSVKGVKNAFETVIVPTELVKLDLEKNVDTKAFLEYRDKLIESIAIALNIPVDLLMPKSSNRSTAEVAYDTLNEIIIQPMQETIMRDLRNGLRDDFGNAVDSIDFVPMDSYDEEKDMKIYTGYKDSGIMTPNEVRAKIGLNPIEGGDTLQPTKSGAGSTTPDTVMKDIQEIQKSIEQAMYGE